MIGLSGDGGVGELSTGVERVELLVILHFCLCSFLLRWVFLSGDGSRGEREFPFPVIPGNTSLKFPVPSLPVAF